MVSTSDDNIVYAELAVVHPAAVISTPPIDNSHVIHFKVTKTQEADVRMFINVLIAHT